MKRFITYLYEYKNAQKIKNIGYIRMDVRNQMVNMQVNIRYPELANETGKLSIIIRKENAYSICIGTVQMKDGQYRGGCNCRYHAIEESPYSFQDAIGIVVLFENGCYLASSWKEEEDEIIAKRGFAVYGTEVLSNEIQYKENSIENNIAQETVQNEVQSMVQDMRQTTVQNTGQDIVQIEKTQGCIDSEETIAAAEYAEETSAENSTNELMYEQLPDTQYTYQKINLNEIANLPSGNWHFMNNSFLLHGFWNYGYLVLKETMEAGKKKFALGIPGFFEHPEMVMAAYFGFPHFASLPPEVAEMAIGQTYQLPISIEKEENQHPKEGTFGCWFVNLR